MTNNQLLSTLILLGWHKSTHTYNLNHNILVHKYKDDPYGTSVKIRVGGEGPMLRIGRESVRGMGSTERPFSSNQELLDFIVENKV